MSPQSKYWGDVSPCPIGIDAPVCRTESHWCPLPSASGIRYELIIISTSNEAIVNFSNLERIDSLNNLLSTVFIDSEKKISASITINDDQST